MKKFNQFKIKSSIQTLVGDKIKMERILNREIIVTDFRLEDSKYGDGNNKCLYLQIEINKQKHVVFTGSKNLIDIVQQVPKNEFPFSTIVVKENDRYEFT